MNDKLRKSFAKIGFDFEALAIYPMSWTIKETEKVSTIGTDYKNLFYSPLFIEQFPIEELVAVVLHEVFHCVFLHPSKVDRDISKNKNMFVWNLALEQVVNSEVIHVLSGTNYKLPGNPVSPIKIVSNDLNDNDVGYVYSFDLVGKNELEVYEILMQYYNSKSEKNFSSGQLLLVDDVLQPQKQSAEEKQQAIEKAVATIQKLQKQGKLSSTMKRFLKNLVNPQVPWQRVLQQFVSQVIDGYEEFSFTKPNIRRQVVEDVVIPATQQRKIQEPVIVFDTSGSIDNSMIKQFVSEIQKLLKNVVENVVVITTDAQVHECVRISSVQDVFKKLKFKGGGGTDFCPLFEQVKNCEFMVFFTDGYAYYPDKAPKYPVLWVLTKNNKRPPFGRVIYVYD